MLKKITLENYTTFINKTSIDFSATNYKFLESENVGSNRILKGCLFVGENASGKTKIIKSIKFLLDILFANREVDYSNLKSFYTDKDTFKLEYTFIESDSLINYSIELDSTKIISEKLLLDNDLILERLGSNGKLILNNEKYFDNLPNKLPLVRRVYFDTNFYNIEALTNWFMYMKKSIYINCYDRTISKYSDQNNVFVHEYLENNSTDEINKFLSKINYKENIEFNRDSDDNLIYFRKEGMSKSIPETLESTGNKTFVEIIPSFLYAVKNDCMILLDEFSSGLHNELEECLIKYFFHYTKCSQLFFTSHSTNILNNCLIRPDQVYSVSFNSKDGSILKRFSLEMPRESQNIEKMYLNGVFDGMPKYNKKFED